MANSSAVVPEQGAIGVGLEDDPTGILGALFRSQKGETSAAMGLDPVRAARKLAELTTLETPPGGVPGGGAEAWQGSQAQPSGAGAGPTGGVPAGPAPVRPQPVQGGFMTGAPPQGPVSRAAPTMGEASNPVEMIGQIAAQPTANQLFWAGFPKGRPGSIMAGIEGIFGGDAVREGVLQQAQAQNAKLTATVKALMENGLSADKAIAIATDPKAMEKIMPTLMPLEQEKARLENQQKRYEMNKPVVVDEVVDPLSGTLMKKYAVINPDTGEQRRISLGEAAQKEANAQEDPYLGGLIARPGETQLRGPAFLEGLRKISPARAERTERIGLGLDPYPTRTQSGQGRADAILVDLAYPGFNTQDTGLRLRTRQNFLNGQVAENIKAISQMDDHVGKIIPVVNEMGQWQAPPLNAARNMLSDIIGTKRHTDVGKFNTLKVGISHEFGRVFKGASPTNFDTKSWEDRFSPNDNKDTLLGNLKEGLDMTRGRLNAIKSQWDSDMNGAPYPKSLVDAEANLNKAETRINESLGGAPQDSSAGGSPAPTGPAILRAPASGPGQAPAAPVGGGVVPGQTTPVIAPAIQPPAPAAVPGQGAPGAPAQGGTGGAGGVGGVSPAPAPSPMLSPTAAPVTTQGLVSSLLNRPGLGNQTAAPAVVASQQTAPKDQAKNAPTVTSVPEALKLPIGSFFKTATQDLFQRIQDAPGFVKVMNAPSTSEPPPPDLSGGAGGAPAPAPSGGAKVPAQGGMRVAGLDGSVGMPKVGEIQVGPDGIVHRYLGGDPAAATSWAPLNPKRMIA